LFANSTCETERLTEQAPAANRRLKLRHGQSIKFGVNTNARKVNRAWRKSRIAARLLYRKAEGPLCARDSALARQLSRDPEVSNRLIQQALYYLGGHRKHELDRKLVASGR
jgi:hypothetical protein